MREVRHGPELRIAGRTLTGTAMVYGDISPDFRERFEPGAFGDVGAVDLNLQHDPSVVLARGATLTDGPRELAVRATLPDGSAALALVRRRALNGFSIEFRAMRERRDPSGIRVVEAADLTGLALVDRGAYPGSTVEVRARRGQTPQANDPGRNYRFVRVLRRSLQVGRVCRGGASRGDTRGVRRSIEGDRFGRELSIAPGERGPRYRPRPDGRPGRGD